MLDKSNVPLFVSECFLLSYKYKSGKEVTAHPLLHAQKSQKKTFFKKFVRNARANSTLNHIQQQSKPVNKSPIKQYNLLPRIYVVH